MDKTVELFGFLILAVLGFVAPITGLFLSTYKEGVLKLTARYRAEKLKTEVNIEKQIKKIEEIKKIKELNTSEIIQNLKKLESIKDNANKKLSLLNPEEQIFNLFAPLIVSFIAIAFSFSSGIKTNVYLYPIFLLISAFFFIYSINVIRILLPMIYEAKKILDDEKKEKEIKTIELLSQISEDMKVGSQVLLNDIYIKINEKIIKDKGTLIEVAAEKKKEFEISIVNGENQMAKNIEIGICFTLDFIIEKKSVYSLFIDNPGKSQIVRYEVDSIQSNTDLILEPLSFTPLKASKYEIKTFVKGENIATRYNYFTLKVID